MDIKNFKFEDWVETDNGENTILYFTADVSVLKEFMGKKYPEADGMTLMLEFPKRRLEESVAAVAASPFKVEGGETSDYDWSGVYMSSGDISALIKKAINIEKMRGIIKKMEDFDRENPDESYEAEGDIALFIGNEATSECVTNDRYIKSLLKKYRDDGEKLEIIDEVLTSVCGWGTCSILENTILSAYKAEK